jgi:hypothetical protein
MRMTANVLRRHRVTGTMEEQIPGEPQARGHHVLRAYQSMVEDRELTAICAQKTFYLMMERAGWTP